ncbi:hypothetical protein [Sulfuricurvum sp.]|uniref:hypothetical protein n=1 Tax=Sulfuricurvum sp. TaxID=2025608 RepID=UPI0026269D17|nr:hypothetical protein [Sulfuricurvum sp.]MDD3596134.1 hypothetical protein [Sulfuricurvum sp.]
MARIKRYDYLSYLLDYAEGTRSNLSKLTKGKLPTKPNEDILFLLDEATLARLCEFHRLIKNGYSASINLSISVSETAEKIESNLSMRHIKYVILETASEIFQTYVPKNKSIRVLFNEFYLEDEIDEMLENEAEFSTNDRSSKEQKQLEKNKEIFIRKEHAKYKQMNNQTNFSGKKILTISIKDYLMNRFVLENLCFMMYEYNKSEILSLPIYDQYTYFLEKLSIASFLNLFHPTLTRSIIDEWWSDNNPA